MSRSRRPAREKTAFDAFDLRQWQRIQDLFARIVHTNLCLLDHEGEPLSRPSRITPFSQEISKVIAYAIRMDEADGVSQAFLDWRHQGPGLTHWRGLHFVTETVGWEGDADGVIVLGPFIVGKRLDDDAYWELCNEAGLDPEIFLDQIGELRVFSHNSIRVIRDLFAEIVQALYERNAARFGLRPTREIRKTPAAFRSQPAEEEIPETLLGIVFRLVDAESGSILMWSEECRAFEVCAQRGLSQAAAAAARIKLGEGVAGWVAASGRPLLINHGIRDHRLLERLNRPSIYASMVVPMKDGGATYGLICVNISSRNERFNEDTLNMIDDLGKVAGLALLRKN